MISEHPAPAGNPADSDIPLGLSPALQAKLDAADTIIDGWVLAAVLEDISTHGKGGTP